MTVERYDAVCKYCYFVDSFLAAADNKGVDRIFCESYIHLLIIDADKYQHISDIVNFITASIYNVAVPNNFI